MVNNDRAPSERVSVNSGERRRRHKVCKTVGGSLPTTLSVSFASALKVTQKQQQPGVNNNLISWRRNADLDYSQRASHPCSAKWKWPRSQFVFIAQWPIRTQIILARFYSIPSIYCVFCSKQGSPWVFSTRVTHAGVFK